MELVKCPWCNLTVADDSTHCPHCRNSLVNPDEREIIKYRSRLQRQKEEMARYEEMQREMAAIDALNAKDNDYAVGNLVTIRVSPDLVVECPECGKNIVNGEEECPYCGANLQKAKWWIWLVVAALVLGIAIGVSGARTIGASRQNAQQTEQSVSR